MSSFPTLVNSPSSTTGLGGTTISLTTASNSSSRQFENNNFNRRVPVVGLSSSSAPSLPSSSSFLLAMTTKKRRHLPFELIYELLKWVPESDCHRIVYRFPWLCHLCTKDRHKNWSGEKHYQQLLRRDRLAGALDIWVFQNCQDDLQFASHPNFNRIVGNVRAGTLNPQLTEFNLSVRLHLNHEHQQQFLNQFLLHNQQQILGAFNLVSFTTNMEPYNGHQMQAFIAEFPHHFGLNTLLGLIRALIAAMNRAELNQLAVLNGQNPANWM